MENLINRDKEDTSIYKAYCDLKGVTDLRDPNYTPKAEEDNEEGTEAKALRARPIQTQSVEEILARIDKEIKAAEENTRKKNDEYINRKK